MPEASDIVPNPDIPPSPERIFLCTEGDASKFWRVKVEGNVQTVRYGRIGTEGHELTKTFGAEEAASKATTKLIAEKLGKGYREVSELEATQAHDVIRAAMIASTAATSPAPRKPRTTGKSVAPSWQQLLLSFEEGIEDLVGVAPRMPLVPKPEEPPVLAFEF